MWLKRLTNTRNITSLAKLIAAKFSNSVLFNKDKLNNFFARRLKSRIAKIEGLELSFRSISVKAVWTDPPNKNAVYLLRAMKTYLFRESSLF